MGMLWTSQEMGRSLENAFVTSNESVLSPLLNDSPNAVP
jgi:hypothetical protein